MNELVLFGVTGDLAKQKLIPSLYNLYSTGKIDKKSSFIGFGRKNFSKTEFQTFIEEVLVAYFSKIPKKSASMVRGRGASSKISGVSPSPVLNAAPSLVSNDIRNFSAQWSYVESELNDIAGYKKLAALLRTDQAAVYVSLPPMYQYQVCGMLISSGVIPKSSAKDAARGAGRKIALEKPYGFDTGSSEKLDAFLTRRLRESQILRVDHYAGKQALVELEAVARQGILKNILSSRSIKKIEVQMNESIDVSTRGSFYDDVGALADTGQNHLLHMLATILAIPEISQGKDRACLSHLRAEALSLLEVSKKTKQAPILGQYESFIQTKGVKEGSVTETFFRVFAQIKQAGKGSRRDFGKSSNVISKRWGGAVIELIGGKALNEADASITLYPASHAQPIKILVNGYGERDAYDQVFMDIFKYNSNRFIDFRQIKLGWAFVEKIKRMAGSTAAARKKKLVIYKKGAYPQDILPA
jgi:glucose-6-phosphate 1-dehydrogenase